MKAGASGITAIAMKEGKQLFRADAGEANRDTIYPVASASKWVTAALVMTVVDEGRLSLDVPISAYLPEFAGAGGKITLRELLAQTAGEGSLKSLVDIRQDPHITLAQSAALIAQRPLTGRAERLCAAGRNDRVGVRARKLVRALASRPAV